MAKKDKSKKGTVKKSDSTVNIWVKNKNEIKSIEGKKETVNGFLYYGEKA